MGDGHVKREEPRTGETVYLVDLDPGTLRWLEPELCRAGLAVARFSSAERFLGSVARTGPGVVILESTLPGMSGLDLQRRLTEMELDLPLIFLSRDADVPTAVQAIRAGAVDFLEKPAAPARLLRRIRQALESFENAPAEG